MASVIAALLTGAVGAQAPRQVSAVKTAAPVPLTANPDDPAWKNAPAIDGFTDISHGNLVGDQTVAKILYDSTNIYILIVCQDSKPDAIVARETVRDSLFNQAQSNNGYPIAEDYVIVSLDPFFRKQNNDQNFFAVNPLGTRSAIIAGGRAAKAEWSGDWEATAKRTPTGWVAQLQIPWRLFHYQHGGKVADVGIDFSRFQYRSQTLSMWSNLGPQGFWEREGVWHGVELPNGGFKHTFSTLPYVLGGIQNERLGGKVGLDARYLVTPELTAVGTLNPDFSTIEAAIQTIQYSHTEIYLPEHRPFFTEGGSDFGAGSNINSFGQFFYSQRIQDFNAGAKLYGKITPEDTLGTLVLQSPYGRNDFAGRWQHVLNPTSTAGMMVVSTNADGGQNTVVEADDRQRWGKLSADVMLANSDGPQAGGGSQQFDVQYADKNTTSLLTLTESSSNFLTPDGYFPYSGYKGVTVFQDYNDVWRHGFWRNFDINGGYNEWLTLYGTGYYNGFFSSASIETRSDFHLEFDYTADSQLGSDDNTMSVNVLYGVTNRFRQVGFQVITGETGGVHSTFLAPSGSFRLFKNFDLSYGGGIQNRAGLTQQHIVTANYQYTPTRAFGGRVVVNNADTNVYLFFHNSGGRGTEYYILFGDPNAPRTVRTIQFKVVFAI